MFNQTLLQQAQNKSWRIRLIFLISFLFSVTIALIAFFQSAFLNQYVSEAQIGTYISLAYVIALVGLIFYGKVISKIGYLKSMLLVLSIDIIGLFLMAYYHFSWAAILGVVIYEASLTLIYLGLDIFLKQDTEILVTGKVRGVYLTIIIIAWIISPAIAGYLVVRNSYGILFKISILILLAIIILLTIFRKSIKSGGSDIYRIDLRSVYQRPDLFKIYIIALFLQLFYCGMVIYLPLYLFKDIGLAWNQIGIIFTIMLFAYLIIEYPAGKLADKYWGEKEMLITGILIASLSCFIIFFNVSTIFWIWLIIMFLTRIGSSLVEIMSETYFFKKISNNDIGTINFYRTAAPLAYIIGPLFFSWLLYFYPLKIVFLTLGLLLILSLYWAVTLKDTK